MSTQQRQILHQRESVEEAWARTPRSAGPATASTSSSPAAARRPAPRPAGPLGDPRREQPALDAVDEGMHGGARSSTTWTPGWTMSTRSGAARGAVTVADVFGKHQVVAAEEDDPALRGQLEAPPELSVMPRLVSLRT